MIYPKINDAPHHIDDVIEILEANGIEIIYIPMVKINDSQYTTTLVNPREALRMLKNMKDPFE